MSLKQFQELYYRLAFSSEEELPQLLNPASDDADTRAVLGLFQQQPLERLQQYRWMVYSNHAETLETIFPYVFQLLHNQWEPLVQRYLHDSPPQSYQLYGAAVAFPEFLQKQDGLLERFPFLADLATYELLEATILRLPDSEIPPDLRRDLPDLEGWQPVINPAARPYTAFYPIDTLVEALKAQPDTQLHDLSAFARPSSLTMWVYRDSTHACRFMKVNPVIQAFLEGCLDSQQAGTKGSYFIRFKQACEGLGVTIKEAMQDGLQGFVPQLVSQGILLGSLAL